MMGCERWCRVVLAGALVLASSEVGVRTIEDELPDPLLWHSHETQRKVEQIDQRSGDGVDVVFFGTSMVNAAVIPSEFEALVEGDVETYNAGLSSGQPLLMEAWSLDVVIPKLSPDLVVIAVSSVDLSDAGDGATVFYDAFVDSPGGERALGTENALERSDRWLQNRSALVANRASLRDPRALWDAIRGEEPAGDPVALSIDDDGYGSFRNTQQFEDRVRQDGIAGVTRWSLGPRNIAALQGMIAGARADGAQVVLVQLPVTKEYVDEHPNGADDYASFERALREIADPVAVPVLDLDAMTDHRFFSDELHLNVDGARLFTRSLADAMTAAGLFP